MPVIDGIYTKDFPDLGRNILATDLLVVAIPGDNVTYKILPTAIAVVGTITTGVWHGAAIANAYLANSSITIGSTNIALGATSLTLTGLSGVSSTTLTAVSLTSGRVPFASTGGLLVDSSAFLFNSGTGALSATSFVGTSVEVTTVKAAGLTSGRVTFATTGGQLTDASTLTFNSGTGALTATTFIGNLALGSITGLGTGVATALAVNVGSAGAFVTFNGALGTPSSGTVTNLTGTASININGTVGATTPTTATFTTATCNTSLVSPLISGSTAANGDISIQGTTSSTRTTSYVNLQETEGYVGINVSAPNSQLAFGISSTQVYAAVRTYTVDGQANIDWYRLNTGNSERYLDIVAVASGDGGSAGGSNIRLMVHSTSASVGAVVGLSISRTRVVTIPNLAGTGSRNVVADANGVLSAP